MFRKCSVNCNRVHRFTFQFGIASLVLKVVNLEYINEKMNDEVYYIIMVTGLTFEDATDIKR